MFDVLITMATKPCEARRGPQSRLAAVSMKPGVTEMTPNGPSTPAGWQIGPPPNPADGGTASVATPNGPDEAVRICSVGSGPLVSHAAMTSASRKIAANRRSGRGPRVLFGPLASLPLLPRPDSRGASTPIFCRDSQQVNHLSTPASVEVQRRGWAGHRPRHPLAVATPNLLRHSRDCGLRAGSRGDGEGVCQFPT